MLDFISTALSKVPISAYQEKESNQQFQFYHHALKYQENPNQDSNLRSYQATSCSAGNEPTTPCTTISILKKKIRNINYKLGAFLFRTVSHYMVLS
jgi:hypothetical protein